MLRRPRSPSRCPRLPGVGTAPPEPSAAAFVGRFPELRSLPCPAADGVPHGGCRAHRPPRPPGCEGWPSAEAAWTSLPPGADSERPPSRKTTHDDHRANVCARLVIIFYFIILWKGNKHKHPELGETDLKKPNRAKPVRTRCRRARVSRGGPRAEGERPGGRARGWGPSRMPGHRMGAGRPSWPRGAAPDARQSSDSPAPRTRLPGRRQPRAKRSHGEGAPGTGSPSPAARGGGEERLPTTRCRAALGDEPPVPPPSRSHMLQEAGALGGVAPELLIND